MMNLMIGVLHDRAYPYTIIVSANSLWVPEIFFWKAPFWNVPIGWYMGAGDAKRSLFFGRGHERGWLRPRVTFKKGQIWEGFPNAGGF